MAGRSRVFVVKSSVRSETWRGKEISQQSGTLGFSFNTFFAYPWQPNSSHRPVQKQVAICTWTPVSECVSFCRHSAPHLYLYVGAPQCYRLPWCFVIFLSFSRRMLEDYSSFIIIFPATPLFFLISLQTLLHSWKGKGKVVPLLNQVPHREDILFT